MPEPFIVNVADAEALSLPGAGSYVRFESDDEPFENFGINVHVLQPGEPNCRYHREDVQEAFLVLAGECIVILDEVEHRLRAWDFVNCPAGAAHVFVGAGDGPCAILMVGARTGEEVATYLPSALAARYNAAVVETETTDSEAAYAGWPDEFTAGKLDWPPPSS
jgi:uncharacterized cupin superfamily protein